MRASRNFPGDSASVVSCYVVENCVLVVNSHFRYDCVSSSLMLSMFNQLKSLHGSFKLESTFNVGRRPTERKLDVK